jgi:hypothetical protein
MFRAYGVTGLGPLDENQLVMDTWLALTDVGLDLLAKRSFAAVHSFNAKGWSKKYARYIDALWSGNKRRIGASAIALVITAGVPGGAIKKK